MDIVRFCVFIKSTQIYEVYSRQKIDFSFPSKNICLFINIYLVFFEVVRLRYNILGPELTPILEALVIWTFWYALELIQRCGLCSSSHESSLRAGILSCCNIHDISCPKFAKKLHGVSQPICRHPEQLR